MQPWGSKRAAEIWTPFMVREAFAWAFTRFSVDYADQQEGAHRQARCACA